MTDFAEFDNWESLGAVLGVPTNLMTYALHHKSELQHPFKVKKRRICESFGCLKVIQSALGLQFSTLYETLDNIDMSFAYRPGIKATDKVKELVGYDYVISFDIKKYFDNITYDHVVTALTAIGFNHAGASLCARYCCQSLSGRIVTQQGSAASPALSNIVGRHYFDIPISTEVVPFILEQPGITACRYVRYCDNMALFINGTIKKELYNTINDRITSITINNGFDTHDWRFVCKNSRDTHQYFLGVVLNSAARIENKKIDNYRATLWNMCIYGIDESSEFKMLRRQGRTTSNVRKSVIAKYRGIINYVDAINTKHGNWLKKLLAIAVDRYNIIQRIDRDKYKSLLLQYKNNNQTVDEFLAMFD